MTSASARHPWPLGKGIGQMSTSDQDPIEFTRVRLKEIAEVWTTFARGKAASYVDKLPDPVRKLMSKPMQQAPIASAGEPGSAAAS